MILFSSKKVQNRFFSINPILIYIIGDMALYCLNKKLPFKINSTVSTEEEDIKYGRVSMSHREGRAVDLALDGWSENQRKTFCKVFNDKYKKEAAVSSKTKRSLLCVYGDPQHLQHIHIQVHKRYTMGGIVEIASNK